MRFVYSETQRILKKYNTRDPYELLDAMGAVTYFSDEYKRGGLKGYSKIFNGILYAVINGNLPKEEQRIVAGHEAAHLILHKKEILSCPTKVMKDFGIFNNSGQYENEANSFLADFLVPDDDALEAIAVDDGDYFSTSRALYIPPQLLAFKLFSMMRRGHKVRSPVDLDSRFLKYNADRW